MNTLPTVQKSNANLGMQLLNLLSKKGRKTYVINPKNYELLFTNSNSIEDSYKGSSEDYKHQKCFKYIYGYDSPCIDCPMQSSIEDWSTKKRYDERNNTWHELEAISVNWEGQKAFAFICFDTTAEEQLRQYMQKKNSTELEKYRKSVQDLLSSNPDSLCTFYLNVTNNTCKPGFGRSAYISKTLVSPTIDGFTTNLLQIIPNKKHWQLIKDMFDKQNMLSNYKSGHTSRFFDYQRKNEVGVYVWVRTYMHLFQNPETKDIECLVYSLDIDRSKNWELIVNELVGIDYDFVSLLDLYTNTITEYSDKGKSYYFRNSKLESIDYTISMKASLKSFIREDKLEDAIKAHSIDTIKEHLAVEPIYLLSFPTRDNREEEWRISYLKDAMAKILIARRDVTNIRAEEKSHIQELQHARELADKANNAKTDFLNRMSHDIRTPLNGIIGLTYLAKDQVNSVQTDEYLNDIDVASKFLLSLINDILDMSKIESGKFKFHPEPVDTEAIRSYVTSVIEPLVNEKKQKFIFDVNMPKGYMALQDKTRIPQIFFNLLSNASKFTPINGTIKFLVNYKFLPGNKQMIMHTEVSDTGIGMSEDFQKVMFSSFTQEYNADTNVKSGTGLGLLIVKKIIEMLHGTIKVESKLGCGSKFTVDIITDCIPESDVANMNNIRHSEYLRIDETLNKKHILMCEDHPLNQKITRALLEKKGIVVDTAENGKIGLEKFQKSALNYYDAILMDIRMPVLDGYGAANAIRALSRIDASTIPIIALSANTFDSDIKKSLKNGMNDHLGKPIDPKILYATLAKFLK